MGPRSFDRGKLERTGSLGDLTAVLQWGRDLSIAERSLPQQLLQRGYRGFNGAAIFRSRKG